MTATEPQGVTVTTEEYVVVVSEIGSVGPEGPPGDDADIDILAAPTGASLVGFMQRGDDAVARTVQGRLRDSVSILDFVPEAEHDAIYQGSSTYDCSAALDAAINSVTTNVSGAYQGGPRVNFPAGHYYFASTIELKKTVILEGDAVGESGGYATLLRFAPNTTGIIVHRHDTIGAEVESPPTFGADASIVRNLQLLGGGSGPRDFAGTGHGIWLRARATIDNVRISHFSEDGIRIVASSSGTGDQRGNANGWHVKSVRITNCGGHGLWISGPDANAGTAIAVNCAYNGRHGISDNSFLGNTYIGCQIDRAGMKGQVSHGGSRYFVLSDTLGGSVEPGTDSSVWLLYGSGGVHDSYPAWASGATYLTGYPYVASSNNATSVFAGCYWESGQPYPHLIAPAIVFGGVLGNSYVTPLSSAFRIGCSTTRGYMTPFEVRSPVGASAAYTVRFCPNVDDAFNLTVTGDHSLGLSPYMWEAANGCWTTRHANAGSRSPVRYTTNLNTLTGGRSAAIGGGNVLFGQGVWIGSSTTTMRRIDNGTAAPTTGEWARGDIRYNSAPSAGGKVGWVCTAAGTPGTWKAFGVIDP